MIQVEEALERILSHIQPLDPEQVEILDALDRVLAEDVVADLNIPPFANSAMDGYAVIASDTIGARRKRPVKLRVIGDLAAGYTPAIAVQPGTAVRIMTGAPIPPGADAVVRFEETSEGKEGIQRDTGAIEVFVEVKSGDNVRPAGEDICQGERVLEKGRVLRPQEIGMLAALGRRRVSVIRRPRVVILATGDELVDIDTPVTPGKIRNINEYSTAALVKRCGGLPICLGIARDTVEHLTAKIREGIAHQPDLFLTSAGVSIGDYDVVKDVLAAEGQIEFWSVSIKPGKPLAFGYIGQVPLIGLPGNPVAALVAFEQFARPALLKMLGKTWLAKPIVRALVHEDIPNSGRRHFVRAIVERREGRYHVYPTGEQGSGILTSMLRANGLLVIPEGVTLVKAGEEVEVQMLDWPENVF